MGSEAAAYLLHTRPRIFWGRVIQVFLEKGWKPPSPDEKVVTEIRKSLEDLEKYGYVALPMEGTRLTPRETALLAMFADGHTNLDIAERMGITEKTVKFHTHNLLMKLPARNRTHAVAIGLREGLIE